MLQCCLGLSYSLARSKAFRHARASRVGPGHTPYLPAKPDAPHKLVGVETSTGTSCAETHHRPTRASCLIICWPVSLPIISLLLSQSISAISQENNDPAGRQTLSHPLFPLFHSDSTVAFNLRLAIWASCQTFSRSSFSSSSSYLPQLSATSHTLSRTTSATIPRRRWKNGIYLSPSKA